MAVRTIENERVRSRPAGEASPEGVDLAQASVREVGVTFDELQRLLAQLVQNATMDDPRLQELARDMTRRQEEIRQNQESLQGKVIEIDLAEQDRAKAEADVHSLCERLLANTVIEDYTVAIDE